MRWTLRRIRQHIGFNQTEVAERFGTTQSSISRIERQEDWLVSTLADYAAALGGRVEVRIILGDGESCEVGVTEHADDLEDPF